MNDFRARKRHGECEQLHVPRCRRSAAACVRVLDTHCRMSPRRPTWSSASAASRARALPSPSPKAQLADIAVRSLSSELAHELRTPLGAIAAAAEIMIDERFGPVGDKRYAAYVAGIHESALPCHTHRRKGFGREAPDAECRL